MSTLADQQISKVSDIVYDKLATVTQWATDAKTAAQQAIESIGLLDVPNIEIQFPQAPEIQSPVAPSITSVPDYVVSNNPQSVTFTPTSQVSFVEPTTVPTPVYGTPVAVPDRPQATLPLPPTAYPTMANPSAPVAPTLSLPDVPVVQLPDAPALLSISVPTAPSITVESFGGTRPDNSGMLAVIDERIARIGAALTQANQRLSAKVDAAKAAEKAAVLDPYFGNTAPEKSIYGEGDYQKNVPMDRMRSFHDAVETIDRELMQKRDELTTAWAGKNFSLVPGMLVGQVNDLEIEAGRKVRELAGKINEETGKTALEDFSRIWELYVELEKSYIDVTLEQARRGLEEEKLRVRTQIELFNASLELYKSKLGSVSAYVEAYNAELSAQLELSRSYKVAVDGAIAETAENSARVAIYNAQVQVGKVQAETQTTALRAATAPLELYKAQLIGVKANADTAVANIEAYREAIRGYASAVETASAEVEAYAAQVAAVSSAAGVAETNAKAYATYIEEAARTNTVFKTFVTEQGEVLSANLQTFRDAGNTNESFLRAQAARIAGQAEITGARVSAFDNYVRNFSSYNRALADKTAAVMNHSMTSAENAARAQALLNQATAETDKIKAGALAGKASALAGLAQGAMSAMHVSASAQGSGSTGSSYGYNRSWTANWGGTTQKSESKVQRLSA